MLQVPEPTEELLEQSVFVSPSPCIPATVPITLRASSKQGHFCTNYVRPESKDVLYQLRASRKQGRFVPTTRVQETRTFCTNYARPGSKDVLYQLRASRKQGRFMTHILYPRSPLFEVFLDGVQKDVENSIFLSC